MVADRPGARVGPRAQDPTAAGWAVARTRATIVVLHAVSVSVSDSGPTPDVEDLINVAESPAAAPVGKRFPPVPYAIGREKIREYARAVGETNPLHHDVAAARAAGYADVVAPPMFVVVYSSPAIEPAMFDPEIGIDFDRLVHGAQEFVWERVLVAGEEVSTVITLDEVRVLETVGLTYYVFGAETTDADGAVVSSGVWTNIVRGADAA